MKDRISRLKILNCLLAAVLIISVSSCGIYSFSGASISPDVRTISIRTFPNNAPLVNPTLSNVLTDAIKDKFLSQTKLDLVTGDADLVLEGEIVDYNTQPVAIQGTETAALNRLTITISVRFTNKAEPEKSFDSRFTRFVDYSSDVQLSTVEDGLIQAINEALVEDVFNKAVVNW